MSDIFLSHSSKDEEAARQIIERLREWGYHSLFLDFDPNSGIPAGEKWLHEIFRQLKSARAVIIACSENSMGSRWCFAEIADARMSGKQLFPIKVGPCQVDSLLDSYQLIDLTTGDAEAAYQALRRGLEAKGLDPRDDFGWDGTRPAYPGLPAFDEPDAAIYHGRKKDIDLTIDALTRMQSQRDRTLAVTFGASGCGKSSLVRAGVVPRLKRDGQRWVVIAPFRPGDAPIEQLARSLALTRQTYGETVDWKQIAESLVSENAVESLADCAKSLTMAAQHKDASVLLVIDQLEEVFSRATAERATAFLDLLTGALQTAGSPLLALATMRSEFLGTFQNHPALKDCPFESIPLLSMPRENLWQVIAEPAAKAGIYLEDHLVDRMVIDTAASDALSQLAFTLREMLDASHDRRFTIAGYEALGGIEGAVGRRANLLVEGMALSETQNKDLRSAFLQLVHVDEEGRRTRCPARWDDLPSAAHPILERFVESRLLVSGDDDAHRTVEVAHECLFDKWDALRKWLQEHRDFLSSRQRLRVFLEEYERGGRPADGLLRGENLRAAEANLELYREALTERERCFIESGIAQRDLEERERRRLRRRALVGRAVAAMLVLITSAAAWQYVRQNRLVRSEAFVTSAVSQLRLDPELSVLLSIEAAETWQTEQAENVLRQSLVASHVRGVLRGHDGLVTSATFIGNGLDVVTASYDATARVWRRGATAMELRGHVTETAVHHPAVSPDGALVVTAGGDKTARIWSASNGTKVAELNGHEGEVYDAEFSPDGTLIVTASGDRTARIWNVKTGAQEKVLRGHEGLVTSATFDPSGHLVVTASKDGTARLWDVATGQETTQAPLRHKDVVESTSFSPDARFVVTASFDETARVWDAATGKEVVALRGHEGALLSAAFSADGRLIVTASQDRTARVWEAGTGREIATLRGHTATVQHAAFSPNAQLVVTASEDATARVWEAGTWREIAALRGHAGGVQSASFSRDGKFVVTAGEDAIARVWEVQADSGFRELPPHEQGVRSAAFSADGGRIVTASEDGTARVWELDGGHPLAEMRGHDGSIFRAAFSNDGKFVVTAGEDASVRVWNASTGEQVRELPGYTGPVNSAAFSNDGRFVVTASEGDEEAVRVWETATWRQLAAPKGHTGAVNGALFSDDGRRLATTGTDHMVCVWSTDDWSKPEHVMKGHEAAVHGAAFSRDGTLLVSASDDKTARIWNVSTGQLVTTLEPHAGPVYGAAFSPDGKFVVTASRDLTARVWEVATGKRVAMLLGHAGPVYSAAFSPNQRLVVTASGDRTTRLYTWEAFAPFGDLLAEAPRRVSHQLTAEELSRYGPEPQLIRWFERLMRVVHSGQ